MTVQVITLEKSELEEMLRNAATFGATLALENIEKRNFAEIMDKRAVAEYLGFSLSKINRLMSENLPFHKKSGEHPRFYKSEIDSWLKSRL